MKTRPNTGRTIMAGEDKGFKVVLSYDVQKTFYVEAENEEEAYDKAYAGDGEVENEDWEYRDHIETEEV